MDETDAPGAPPTTRRRRSRSCLTEIGIGCARVSAGGQKVERRIDALTAVGCITHAAMLHCLRAGGTLVAASLDRLGRSLRVLIAIVGGLRERGNGFRCPRKVLVGAGGHLGFAVFAEFIRELLVEAGAPEGLGAAHARHRGRRAMHVRRSPR